MLNILIAEDEEPIRELIRVTLESAGYCCTVAADGEAAANLAEAGSYDLAVLDIMLPSADGYELLDYLTPLGIPVIFVTAKATLDDRVKGLRLGADDYIVKPFEPAELVARVESVLRRAGKGNHVLTLHGVTVDPENRTVIRNGEPVDLAPREIDLLILLLRNAGKTLYREYLYEQFWDSEEAMETRTLDTHIQRLRRKLGWKSEIKTVYKYGYRLERES